ncbi:MAG: hypothetical protein M1823_005422 [Watsoniomyces obsoletus]|nr:MAG: hypothetical protein M1823_005422 [Watsoniomyces obsoletus]
MLSFSPTIAIVADLMSSLAVRPRPLQPEQLPQGVDETMGLDGTNDFINQEHNEDVRFEPATEHQNRDQAMTINEDNNQSTIQESLPPAVVVSSSSSPPVPTMDSLFGPDTTTTSSSNPTSGGDFYTDPQIRAIMERGGSQGQGQVIRTSQSVSRLYEMCQPRGLQPEFQFEEPWPQNFRVKLIIAGKEIPSEPVLFPNKKAAKEAVARKAVEVLENDPEWGMVMNGGNGVIGGGAATGENWVGKLMEYYQKKPSTLLIGQPPTTTTTTGPLFLEYSSGTTHACECIIDQRRDQPFGGRDRKFGNKKAAKMNAAKEAWGWLEENGWLG